MNYSIGSGQGFTVFPVNGSKPKVQHSTVMTQKSQNCPKQVKMKYNQEAEIVQKNKSISLYGKNLLQQSSPEPEKIFLAKSSN